MCLSNVYEQKPEGESLLCRNVANVRIEADKLTFINIMGIQTEYSGKLCSVDLMENKIFVTAHDGEQ